MTFFGVVFFFWLMGNFQTVDKIFWFIWWIPEMIDTMFYKYVYNYNNNNQEIVRQMTFKEEWANSISHWIVFGCILLLIWSILSVVCWIALKFAVSCFFITTLQISCFFLVFGYYCIPHQKYFLSLVNLTYIFIFLNFFSFFLKIF